MLTVFSAVGSVIITPNEAACKTILTYCLEGLGDTSPKIAKLIKNQNFAACAALFIGLDGRTIRKTVANALASDTSVALRPETLTVAHLKLTAQMAQKNRALKGAK